MKDNNNSTQSNKEQLLPDIDFRNMSLSIPTIMILKDIFADGDKLGNHTLKSLFEKFPKNSDNYKFDFLYELRMESKLEPVEDL